MLHRWIMVGFVSLALAAAARAQEAPALLARIKAIGKEGVGNVEGAKAWKALVAKGPAVVPDILNALDDAGPIPRNWLRAAVESIQDTAIKSGDKLPESTIEAFLLDTRHAGPARRLAYETLVRIDPKTPDRLLPKMLDDPSAELRRDAVAVQLDHGKNAAFKNNRKQFYTDLLKFARDRDQVDEICKQLKTEGIEIDQTAHYGFVTRWLLAGPFDNTKGVGFQAVYPPEKSVDAKADYLGKDGAKVRWREHATTEPLGLVDLNKAVGKLKGAVVFGYAVVESAKERPIELRAGSNNAVRIWLNGKEIYFREEYHHGFQMDQHVGQGVLKAGRNEILIKVCQNEQTDSWAQLWSFQLRVCDSLGGAVPVKNVTPTAK